MTQRFFIDEAGRFIGSYDGPDEELPEGYIDEVTVPPGDIRQLYNRQTGEWGPVVVAPVLPAEVDAERDRRITAGFTFNGVFFQSRPEDRENIAGASTAAIGAMMAGAQEGDFRWTGADVDFTWIAADNSEMPLDAQGMFALGTAAMAHKESHIRAARALKNFDPIPADFATNPVYWPAP